MTEHDKSFTIHYLKGGRIASSVSGYPNLPAAQDEAQRGITRGDGDDAQILDQHGADYPLNRPM